MVNVKIEGFYDVCKVTGLTGRQGVCIPAGNIKNLVLRSNVRQVIREGKFHIYPIETVDQGLELLSDIKAGAADLPQTLYWLINQQLMDMAQSLRHFNLADKTTETLISEQKLQTPQPPKTSDEQP